MSLHSEINSILLLKHFLLLSLSNCQKRKSSLIAIKSMQQTQGIQHKTQHTEQSANTYDCMYFQHTAVCTLFFILHIYCWTHTNTFQSQTLMHANNITDAEAPYSQTVKWAGSVHLHSYSLHICLFFPEGAPPALGEQWKSCWWCSTESVSEGGGSGARPGLSNRHTESQAEDQPLSEHTSAHEQSRGERVPARNTLSVNTPL